MLKVPAPYPQVGSYALFVDDLLATELQRAELVRLQSTPLGKEGALVSWPLRVGSSGSRRVPLADLIDATPLTKAEEREMHDLDRELRGRKRPDKAKAPRCEALRRRHIMSTVMEIELNKLARIQSRAQPSPGSLLPKDIAA